MSTAKYEAYPSLKVYDRLGVPYVLTSQEWTGPLWTGHCMMLSTADRYGDEGFLHELMHWIEASPEQRRYPDFALGVWVNADAGQDAEFATSTSPYYFHGEKAPAPRAADNRNMGWGEPTIPLDEATRQEEAACCGMFFYHVLVGNTTWSKPVSADAAYDFNGTTEDVVPRSLNIINTISPRKIEQSTIERYAENSI